MDPASRAAAVQLPRFDIDLPHAGEQFLGIVGIDVEVRTPRVLVNEQDPLPILAPVVRTENASLFLPLVGIAQGADVYGVGVVGVNDNPSDPRGLFQSRVGPRSAPVHRLVDAVTGRCVGPDVEGLSRTGPHLVGSRRCDR